MKIIVSSASLANALNKLSDDVDSIITYGSEDNTEVRLCAGEYYSSVHCISRDNPKFIDQVHRRWDSVKSLVNNVSDQPIVLDITESKVDVIFSY